VTAAGAAFGGVVWMVVAVMVPKVWLSGFLLHWKQLGSQAEATGHGTPSGSEDIVYLDQIHPLSYSLLPHYPLHDTISADFIVLFSYMGLSIFTIFTPSLLFPFDLTSLFDTHLQTAPALHSCYSFLKTRFHIRKKAWNTCHFVLVYVTYHDDH
jgi:hypothetical protein